MLAMLDDAADVADATPCRITHLLRDAGCRLLPPDAYAIYYAFSLTML